MSFDQVMSLFGAVVTLVGGMWALIKVAAWQFERRLTERFDALEKSRKADWETSQQRFEKIENKYTRLDGELKTTGDKIGHHAEQIARLESDLKHIPTHDDIGGVYRELQIVSGGVQALNGEMKGLRAQVELITKHMINEH